MWILFLLSILAPGYVIETNESIGERWAFLIGVGDYRNEAIPDLNAPGNDVVKMREVLVKGYGFKAERVVTLVNDQATLKNFYANLKPFTGLGPNDLVVFYFSGHGSRVCDLNGDESDGLDESLLFHEADPATDEGHLTDDMMNVLLNRLSVRHVVAIVDACHASGRANAKAIKPPDCDGVVNVSSKETEEPLELLGSGDPKGDAKRLVVMTAVADSRHQAYEDGEFSVFTKALVDSLTQSIGKKVTYSALGRMVTAKTRANEQVSAVLGATDQVLFGGSSKSLTDHWEILTAQSTIVAVGVPLPGLGEGAVVAVYPSDASEEELKKPESAKGEYVIVRENGPGSIVLKPRDAGSSLDSKIPKSKSGALLPGDLVVLRVPAESGSKLRLKLAAPSDRNPVPGKLVQFIRDALKEKAAGIVELVDQNHDFLLAGGDDGSLFLRGGGVGPDRWRLPPSLNQGDQAVRNIMLHAIQKNFLQLAEQAREENKGALKLTVLPREDQPACVRGKLRSVGSTTSIPVCTVYQLRVTYRASQGGPLKVGGLLLSSDGSIAGFPFDGIFPELLPGASHDFQFEIKAKPPLDMNDHILLIGVPPGMEIPLNLFNKTATGETRGFEVDDVLAFFRGEGERAGYTVKTVPKSWAVGLHRVVVVASPEMKTSVNHLKDPNDICQCGE